ncbi:hypothetical protein F0562_016028 [Nyssa sinensis]|uniref:Uncharacterized protein n=1 Tax=Nyssa sinensis TaxID=561372 RepID=A0A5J4ZLB5_9ASTE|nr:hypothetical protein F0562_016028 [Nyssa sinensis]
MQNHWRTKGVEHVVREEKMKAAYDLIEIYCELIAAQKCDSFHSVAYNTIFLGEFMQPDWDMFHSLYPMAEYHGAARAVGGYAIYVSDKPGQHDFNLLKKLVLPDGSILRAKLPVEVPKKKVKKINIPVSELVYGGMAPVDVQKAVENEFEMALQDCVIEETKDKKNVVEAYVVLKPSHLYVYRSCLGKLKTISVSVANAKAPSSENSSH